MEAKIEGVVNPSRREAAEDNCHLRTPHCGYHNEAGNRQNDY